MNIRQANHCDVIHLSEMNMMLIKDEDHRNTMNFNQLKERMGHWLRTEYKAAIFDVNDSLIGYTLWREEEEHLYIRQFYILPNYRRKGEGTSAIESLKETLWADHRLRLEVLVKNQAGVAFWRSVGFSDYGLTLECDNATNPIKKSSPSSG